MISYNPFWKTIKKMNISTYQLEKKYAFSRSLIDKLKHNKGLSTSTLDYICKKLHCDLCDIAEYISDDE